jgi:hypothetical protein
MTKRTKISTSDNRTQKKTRTSTLKATAPRNTNKVKAASKSRASTLKATAPRITNKGKAIKESPETSSSASENESDEDGLFEIIDCMNTTETETDEIDEEGPLCKQPTQKKINRASTSKTRPSSSKAIAPKPSVTKTKKDATAKSSKKVTRTPSKHSTTKATKSRSKTNSNDAESDEDALIESIKCINTTETETEEEDDEDGPLCNLADVEIANIPVLKNLKEIAVQAKDPKLLRVYFDLKVACIKRGKLQYISILFLKIFNLLMYSLYEIQR